jgi:uncharacterized protein YidB (DUF937 family)
MLENIMDLVKQHAGSAISNNPNVPKGKEDEIAADASSSIVSGLKSAVANGNLDTVVDFFKGGEQAAVTSPVSHNIQAGFIQNLTQKYGLDQGKAMQIASSILPLVLQKFVSKTNDTNDKGFDLSDILGKITGEGGIGEVLKNLGDDKGKEGGVVDKLKGFFN